MVRVGLEVLVIFVLILVNAILAMSEIAIIYARKVRLQKRADGGDRRAAAAVELANAPTRFLSTIQIGITLVGILAGAFGGATIAEELGEWIGRYPPLSRVGEAIGVSIVVCAITFLSLIIGELVPKRMAMNHAERFALLLAPAMRRLSKVGRPAVWLLTVSTDAVLRVLRVQPRPDAVVSEEEVTALIEEGTQRGVFARAEHDMVTSVFRLDQRRADQLMTRRQEVAWLDVDDSNQAIQTKILSSGHSHFPVAQGRLDNILGLVRAKDLLAQMFSGKRINIKAAVQPVSFVPATSNALDLLEQLRKERNHVAMVVDEYGGIEGIITVNDILGAIAGAMPLLRERDEPTAFQRKDGSWLIDAQLEIDRLCEVLRLSDISHHEMPGNSQTLGGVVMACLGRLPRTGDQITWNNWRLEVVDMDGVRIDKILATREKSEED